MNECSTNQTHHFTGCASLAAIGVKLSQLKLFPPIRTTAQIRRKTIKHNGRSVRFSSKQQQILLNHNPILTNS